MPRLSSLRIMGLTLSTSLPTTSTASSFLERRGRLPWQQRPEGQLLHGPPSRQSMPWCVGDTKVQDGGRDAWVIFGSRLCAALGKQGAGCRETRRGGSLPARAGSGGLIHGLCCLNPLMKSHADPTFLGCFIDKVYLLLQRF